MLIGSDTMTYSRFKALSANRQVMVVSGEGCDQDVMVESRSVAPGTSAMRHQVLTESALPHHPWQDDKASRPLLTEVRPLLPCL